MDRHADLSGLLIAAKRSAKPLGAQDGFDSFAKPILRACKMSATMA
jgi:hypothetical protein